MTEALVTRQQMVDWMETDGHACVTERPQSNWRRLNTCVADQGEGYIDAPLLGFHLFELAHAGRLDVRVDGEMEAGDTVDVALVPGALTYHAHATPGSYLMAGHFTVQQIYIDDAVFRETAAAIAPGDPDNLKPLGFHGIFEPNLKRVALDILEEARSPSAGGELYADLLAQQIALLILRRRLNGRGERKGYGGKLSQSQMALIGTFLEDHIEETGGLDTLAGLLEMDVFSFTRAFKATTGETPHRYLIQRRIARARDLLTNTAFTLADIAYACGFSSQSHMTSTFTKHAGISPGRYRKEVRS